MLSDQVKQIAMNKQFETIESQLIKLNKDHQTTLSNLTTKVDALAKNITSNSSQLATLKTSLDELHKEGILMESEEGVLSHCTSILTNDSVANITVGVVDEQREREKRKLNMIIHNVSESTKETGPERKADCIATVNSLLHEHLGISATISNAIRLGKKSDRPRLLKISVASMQGKICHLA